MRLRDETALKAILARPGYAARDQSARGTQAESGRPGKPPTAGSNPARASKFGNEKTAGFDSKREAKRGAELELLLQAGKIFNLRRQVRFELIPRQVSPTGRVLERATHYKADFVYVDEFGETVVEDAKGEYRNDVWPIKRKLMLHVHHIRVCAV